MRTAIVKNNEVEIWEHVRIKFQKVFCPLFGVEFDKPVHRMKATLLKTVKCENHDQAERVAHKLVEMKTVNFTG